MYEVSGTRGSNTRSVDRGDARLAGDSGYAVIDSLVALTLLATTIIFSLATAHQAQRMAQAALEVRQATSVLRYLVERSGVPTAASSGQAGHVAWRVAVSAPEATANAASMCAHAITLRDDRSHRVYSAATARICQASIRP